MNELGAGLGHLIATRKRASRCLRRGVWKFIYIESCHDEIRKKNVWEINLWKS